jgi:hypothetical protein
VQGDLGGQLGQQLGIGDPDGEQAQVRGAEIRNQTAMFAAMRLQVTQAR